MGTLKKSLVGTRGRKTQGRKTQSFRRGIATLWTILTLPVMVLLAMWAVEAGRLYLARQQLVTALESAALSAAKTWRETDGRSDTLVPRNTAQEFALANVVMETPTTIATNYDRLSVPNQNASCDGDLVFGTVRDEIGGQRVFYPGLRAGCGKTDGPNAHATYQMSTNGWQTVTFCNREYEDMVVVGTPVYQSTNRPMVVRIQNAMAGDTFEFFVQDTNSGAPVADIPVHFFVVEAGVYNFVDHGVTMEALKFDSTVTDRRGSWVAQPRPYANAYTQPVVVGQVMTFNDPDWSVFWEHGGTRATPPGTNLFVGKHVGQDPDTTRADETLGYVVFEEGAGSINGLPYYAALGPDIVVGMLNGAPNTYALPGDIANYVVATKATEAGGNGAWVVAYGPEPLRPNEIDFGLDEYNLADRRHTTEQVAHVVFGGPYVVRARRRVVVPWLSGSLFGCTLFPTEVSANVVAMVEGDDRCPKLICVDGEVCP